MGFQNSAADPSTDPRANYDYQSEAEHDSSLVSDLEALVDGDVRFDEYSKQMYATDASAYEVTPIGVVYPTSTEDVAAVMGYCADEEIPVLPRGGGTSLAGKSVNRAIVLDFTRDMTDVLYVKPEARHVRARTGITLGELNRTLEPHELTFAPDPSTADRSALGDEVFTWGDVVPCLDGNPLRWCHAELVAQSPDLCGEGCTATHGIKRVRNLLKYGVECRLLIEEHFRRAQGWPT